MNPPRDRRTTTGRARLLAALVAVLLGIMALVMIVGTRGRLGYKTASEANVASPGIDTVTAC